MSIANTIDSSKLYEGVIEMKKTNDSSSNGNNGNNNSNTNNNNERKAISQRKMKRAFTLLKMVIESFDGQPMGTITTLQIIILMHQC